MKVRLSKNAATYVRNEAAYLSQHSRGATERFLERVKSVRQDLSRFAHSGFADETLPMPGMRRFIRDGYRYDYRVSEQEIEIANISSSVNTPLLDPSDDDLDFETDPADDG